MADINKSNPFPAKIKERIRLTKKGSTKETYHIVLELQGSGMHFKVGDSIGVFAANDPDLVQQLLGSADGNKKITDSRTGAPMPLREFLTHRANLSRLDMDKIDSYAPLLPRFYSVASSLKTHPDEVHLTVVVSTYEQNGKLQYGVASHFLCHLAEVGKTPIPCYVLSTPHFTLPQDDSKHIIMVGPGTGVAPFRGFLQERMARAAAGKNWLFFGERNRAHDYLYEEFWSPLIEKGNLRLDLAFSRDQAEKLYVQHKILENSSEIWKWMEEGAHFYVCGDADPMAKEVEASFLSIAQKHGGFSETEARDYLRSLRQQKRYLIDVY